MSTTNPEIGAKILPVHEDVIPQLNELSLNTSKPLLISDADEVILDFLGSFEKYLLTFNLKIDLSTYSLLGNIFWLA